MSGILAIEPSPQRRGLLAALLREHAKADLTMVTSVQAALDVFEERQPDVIVAPALLSPEDSDRLCAYVRRHAAPHVQMFTVPALDLLRRPPDIHASASWFSSRRRAAPLALQYDPASLGRQIAERLEHARQLREREPSPFDLRSIADCHDQIDDPPVKAPDGEPAPRRSRDERRRADRIWQPGPGLWRVQLPWSTQADVANISRSGILLESASKVSSGITLDLRLSAMGVDRVVAARFVRTDVAHVDSRGVRYHLAAQFEQPLDLLPTRHADADTLTPRSLVDLFASALSDSPLFGDRSLRFARGLSTLVGARSVVIRRAPVAPSDDSESIYFTVSTDEARPMILQVFFDPHRPPSPIEFGLLKAAAPTAAALLELERLAAPRLLTAGVA